MADSLVSPDDDVIIDLDADDPRQTPTPDTAARSGPFGALRLRPLRKRPRTDEPLWDGPSRDGPLTRRPLMGRRTPLARIVVMLGLALAVGIPQSTTPTLLSRGRPVPLPSYCTGAPIPGGRLNIVRDDTYIILDATTNTVVSTGRCPHGTGTRSNTETRTSTRN
ncbi:hypothetical protein [Dactylosporangium sp. NPDC051541]|uniref:hypothetical protein n=1 Tax=Dactylosporangium sp. NPDC051541 TaxID=3363977 RepID=UPI0037A36343